jgi:molecular chaperone Hsp33
MCFRRDAGLTCIFCIVETEGMDKLVHGMAADGTIRVLAAITTDLTAEAIRRHKTSPTASAALGRTMTGALLLGATLKDFDRLTIKIDSDGPIEGLVAEAGPEGVVRGYVKNRLAESPTNSNGKFDVSGVVGRGTLYVIREAGFEIGFRPEPYVGSVPIVSGEIAEDIAYYLARSEQIPSAVLLGVLLQNTEPYVAASGGVMLQMMPGANEHIVTMIEDTVNNAPHLTSVIGKNSTPVELLKLALGEIEFAVLEEKDVRFSCNCSLERAGSMILALGKEEIRSMIEEDKGAVMTCGFCNEKYEFDEAGLDKILRELAA